MIIVQLIVYIFIINKKKYLKIVQFLSHYIILRPNHQLLIQSDTQYLYNYKPIISNSNLRTVTKYIYIKYTKINFPRIFCYPRNISFQLFRLSPCLNYSSNRCVQNRVIRIYNEKYISQSHYPQDSSSPNHISTTRNHSSVQSEPTQ